MDNGNSNGMIMPVSPMYGGYGNNGFGFGGDGAWWLIILFLFAAMSGFGGWGGNFGGFGGGLGIDFPWLLNGQNGINANTNDGFAHAATQSALGDLQNSVTTGFGNVQLGIAGINQNLCQTGNNVVNAVNGAQNAISQQLNTNELTSLNRSFAEQTANMQGFNTMQSQLAQCCCDNRLATAQTQALVQSENCADRAALSDGIRDILTATQNQTQRILDVMCQDKIDAKNDEIAQLRQEVLFARGQASQIAQNQTIVDNIYNRLDTCPVGTTPVYGRTPIFSCNNNGCGCGFNNF
mgnify:CR=1 FL=1